jgi:hypothetical protein
MQQVFTLRRGQALPLEGSVSANGFLNTQIAKTVGLR